MAEIRVPVKVVKSLPDGKKVIEERRERFSLGQGENYKIAALQEVLKEGKVFGGREEISRFLERIPRPSPTIGRSSSALAATQLAFA